MPSKDFKQEISEEVATILASDFKIAVSETTTVPHASDGTITFPNLDAKRQGAKYINTAVLYIDIRRSTQLNIEHRPQTVAKLYSAFVRAMTKIATEHNGHVRGIIGDRIMVIFDRENCFVEAVECAITMNSTSQFILNQHFPHGEIACGIGIDAGRMLATKTGVRRKGAELASYRNLVWLGRPANVASKLTDLANKPAETVELVKLDVAYQVPPSPFAYNALSIQPQNWEWRKVYPRDFVQHLKMGLSYTLTHNDPAFRHAIVGTETYTRREKTAPILMTKVVWDGFRLAQPQDVSVKNGWFKSVKVDVPGYSGEVFGGDVIWTSFRP